MVEKNMDRRVRKTKAQLRKGLTELLMEKPTKDITVRELADRVDINRGTFYLHYRDVFDMVDQIEDELFGEFREILAYADEPAPLSLLEQIFQFLSDNADMGAALLGPNGDMAFVEKLKTLVREKFLDNMFVHFDTKKTRWFEPYYAFVVGGVIALFQNWLETDMANTPREMAQMAEAFIVDGIEALKRA